MFGSCWHHLNLNPFCQCCGMTGHIQIYLFIQQATQEKVCSDIPCETIYLVTYAEWRDIWNHLHTFFFWNKYNFSPNQVINMNTCRETRWCREASSPVQVRHKNHENVQTFPSCMSVCAFTMHKNYLFLYIQLVYMILVLHYMCSFWKRE